MREMKNRLLAIEAELQTLYRETGDESEVSGFCLCGNKTALCCADYTCSGDFLTTFSFWNWLSFMSSV